MTQPHIALLREDNARQGFFEPEHLRDVLKHLPEELRPVVKFAYITGMRVKSEVLTLEWRHVDLKAGEVRLEPGTTKNKAGRTFRFTAEVRTLPEARHAEHERLKKQGVVVPWGVLSDGRRRAPRQEEAAAGHIVHQGVKTACRKACCPGRPSRHWTHYARRLDRDRPRERRKRKDNGHERCHAGARRLRSSSSKLIASAKDEHSTERADLRGQRFLVAEELTENRALNVTAIKQVTDVVQIKARYVHKDNPTLSPAGEGCGDDNWQAELPVGDTGRVFDMVTILNATLDLELRRKSATGSAKSESLFTQAPLARAEGRDADVVGLLGDARRRRVEIGDRPGIAECNAELARLPQRPVPA